MTLGPRTRVAALIARVQKRLGLHDRALADRILRAHHAKVVAALQAGGVKDGKKKVNSFLKPLRERREARDEPTPLRLGV